MNCKSLYIGGDSKGIFNALNKDQKTLFEKGFCSNVLLESDIYHFEEKDEYSASIYEKSKEKLKGVAKEFYTDYEGTSLYNESFNFWFYLRFNAYLQLVSFYKIINWLDALEQEKKIEEYVFVNVGDKVEKLLALRYKNSKFINVNLNKTENKLGESKLKLAFKLAKVFSIGFVSYFSVFKKKKKTLLVSNSMDFSKLMTSDGIIKEDKFIYYISEQLKESTFDRVINTNIYSKQGLLHYSTGNDYTKIQFKGEALLFCLLFKPSFYREIFKAYFFIKRIKNGDKNFLTVLINNHRGGVYSELIVFWKYYYFLKRRKYKNVILSDEMSPSSNPIVRAAKKLKINTIGIQHGLIFKDNCGYNYSAEELKVENPYPSSLVVWGNEEDNYFVKDNSLFKDIIKPYGNILLDGCKYLPSKNKVSKFVVLFATQPQPIIAKRDRTIRDFVSAIQKFDKSEIKIIIRLHPREVRDYSIYNKYFEQLGEYDFIVDKGDEIFSQLNQIDVLVTGYSTVAKDATVLKKPIILLDYELKDSTGLIDREVAYRAVNSKQLFDYINGIKNGSIKIKENNYEKALDEQFSSLDFNVSEKIISLLI
jgi:hypothetical protein